MLTVKSFGYGGANAHCILDHPSVVIPGYQLRGFRTSSGISIPAAPPNTNGLTNGVSNGLTNGQTNGNVDSQQDDNKRYPSLSWCTPIKPAQVEKAGVRQSVLLPLSAHDEQALKSSVSKISTSFNDFDHADVLYTLSCRRSNFSRRAFAVVESGTLGDEIDPASLVYGKAPSTPAKRIGFVFTGQGAQWPESESIVPQPTCTINTQCN